MTYRGVRERSAAELAVVGLFVAAYAPMALASRAVLFYSSLAVFPFACIVIGRSADAAAERFPALARGWAAAALVSAVFLYPLATARPVPTAIYAPVLRLMRIFGGVDQSG